MHIDTNFKSIDDVLKMGFLIIPRFQRPYSWEEQQIEEFWQDCILEQGDSEYFIGSLVLYKEGSKYGIVDGQQRLTTLTMMLCCLRDGFFHLNEDDLGKGLNQLIARTNLDNKEEAVLSSESSVPYFQCAIQKLSGTHAEEPKSVEERRIAGAYAFIRGKLDESVVQAEKKGKSAVKRRQHAKDQLLKIRDRVLGLKTVALTLDNDVDAYMIFETLNTRGKDLELSDLVRTHFTKCIPQANANTDQTRKRFDDLRKMFDANARKLDDFVLHFWLSRYEYTAKRKIYQKLKRTVNKSTARQFFNEFLRDGELYLDLTVPSRKKWTKDEFALVSSLKALRLFKVEQPNPFVLSVIRAYQTGAIKLHAATRAVGAVENFHFAFTAVTSSRSSGGISQMFARHAAAIASTASAQRIGNEINELIEKLRAKRPGRCAKSS